MYIEESQNIFSKQIQIPIRCPVRKTPKKKRQNYVRMLKNCYVKVNVKDISERYLKKTFGRSGD
jgi:hypothetical protein